MALGLDCCEGAGIKLFKDRSTESSQLLRYSEQERSESFILVHVVRCVRKMTSVPEWNIDQR